MEMFARTNLETLGSAFAIMMFQFREAEAVTYTSMAQGAVGALTLMVYILYIIFKAERL